jgi:hypothetical protein
MSDFDGLTKWDRVMLLWCCKESYLVKIHKYKIIVIILNSALWLFYIYIFVAYFSSMKDDRQELIVYVAFIFLYLCFILHFLLFNLIIFLTYGIL